MNLYNVYFVSKGTGPRTVQIEAQNSAGVKAQVEARYPGAEGIRHAQYHAEPVTNICEKEKRIVTHTADGFEYRKFARVFSSDFSDFQDYHLGLLVPQGESTGQQLLPAKSTMTFDLQKAQSLSEIPACRGPEILALLIEVNPIQEPELQRYPARVEKFSSNFVIRKLLGDVTVPFVEAAVERMFNADEVTSVVDLAKLECLKRKIVSLFFTQRELL